MFSSCAKRSDACLREPEQLGELRRVEVALVEQLLGRLDDRCDDPGLRDDAAGSADGAAADLRGDRPDLERELRRTGERVAPLVHRCRAGVRSLAPPRDQMALDAEGAEHDAEREIHRLEHRAPARCAARGRRPRCSSWERAARALSRSTPCAASASGSETPFASVRCLSSSWSAIEPAAALEPKSERPKRAPSSSAQLTSRTVSGGCPSSATRRSTSTPAMTLRQPSSQPPFGTESMCPPIRSARSDAPRQREPLVARLVDLLHGAGLRDLAAQPLARLRPGVGPGHALRPVLVPRELLELAQLVHGPAWRQGHSLGG